MSDAAAKKAESPASPNSGAAVEQNNKDKDANPNWSAWYNEAQDNFSDFATFDPSIIVEGMGGAVASTSGGERTLSARQISGMLEGEKAVDGRWAEDWNDEDEADSFDIIAEKCGLTRQGGNVAQN